MDGGTGSELQRRGVEVLLGSQGDKLGPWSATANLDAADVVQQVHQDYLRVGADIIISNNFRTTRTRLAPVGLGDRWTEYARAGGRIAVRARNAINPEAYVAGGMAAPGLGMLHDLSGDRRRAHGGDAYRREFAEHAQVLAETGVDVMLPEFVNYIADCVAAVDACAEAGRPVWLGVPMVTTDGITRNGETMEDLAAALQGHPVQAVLLMCSRPEAISATLPRLRQAFEGPIGAYPNVGYNPMAPVGGRVHLGPDLTSAEAHGPRAWRSSPRNGSRWAPRSWAAAAPPDPSTSWPCGRWWTRPRARNRARRLTPAPCASSRRSPSGYARSRTSGSRRRHRRAHGGAALAPGGGGGASRCRRS